VILLNLISILVIMEHGLQETLLMDDQRDKRKRDEIER
jgi:hypothetical protein